MEKKIVQAENSPPPPPAIAFANDPSLSWTGDLHSAILWLRHLLCGNAQFTKPIISLYSPSTATTNR